MGTRRLHGVPISPFVRKVRFVLGVKGLDYELEPVVPMAPPPDFAKLSPLGKIPCYEDDDVVLPDSSVICAYLERIAPEPSIYPSDPAEFGRALWLEEYSDTRFMDEVGPVFSERFINARVYKQPANEEIVRVQTEERLPLVFNYLEGQIEDPIALVGGRFSIADAAVTSVMINLHLLDAGVDAGRWPRLADYFDRQLEHPVIAKLLAAERASMDAMK